MDARFSKREAKINVKFELMTLERIFPQNIPSEDAMDKIVSAQAILKIVNYNHETATNLQILQISGW